MQRAWRHSPDCIPVKPVRMGKRYVSIWFPNLATDWFALRQPALRGRAFVLKTLSRGRMLITAASPLAQQHGIRVGMAVADARVLLPALDVLDEHPGLEQQLQGRIAEWCIRFTPRASVDPLGGVILDASGCAHLWGGEEAYVTSILKKLANKGYFARACMADTIGVAWANARYAREVLVVPVNDNRNAIRWLPPAALRLESATVERLHQLGLHQVQDLLALPRKALRRRFGTPILLRLMQALGEIEEPIEPVYPPEPWQERLPCLEPILTRGGIEIALQQLLQQLCTRLQGEGKGLRQAYFRGYRIDGQPQGIEIATSRPSQSVKHLFHLFELKLGTIAPGMGIELFVLEATRVEDQEAVQESLWETNGAHCQEELAQLIDRIAGKIGADPVRRFLPAAHYWPERSFVPARSLDETALVGWKIDRPRPLLLLPQPERVDVTAPIPDYPPMLFRHKGVLHKIARADGPERIEREWWIGEGQHRDYYYVEDEAGKRYWLFRSGHYNDRYEWYLHGYFP